MSKKTEMLKQLKDLERFGLSITTTASFYLKFAPEEGELPYSAWIELEGEEHLNLIKAWLDTDKVEAYENVNDDSVSFYLPDHGLTFIFRF